MHLPSHQQLRQLMTRKLDVLFNNDACIKFLVGDIICALSCEFIKSHISQEGMLIALPGVRSTRGRMLGLLYYSKNTLLFMYSVCTAPCEIWMHGYLSVHICLHPSYRTITKAKVPSHEELLTIHNHFVCWSRNFARKVADHGKLYTDARGVTG